MKEKEFIAHIMRKEKKGIRDVCACIYLKKNTARHESIIKSK